MDEDTGMRESHQSAPYDVHRIRAQTSFNKPSLESSFANNRKSLTSRNYGKSNVRSRLQLEEMNIKNLHSFQSSLVMEGDTSYQSANMKKLRSNTFNEDQRNNSHGSMRSMRQQQRSTRVSHTRTHLDSEISGTEVARQRGCCGNLKAIFCGLKMET